VTSSATNAIFFKPVNKNAVRLEQLRTLKQAVVEAQSTVIKALKADLNKPEFEAYAAEVGVIKEIDYANISSLGPRLRKLHSA